MKVAIYEAEQWERDALRPLEGAHEVRFFDEPLRPGSRAAWPDARIVSVSIYSSLTPEVLEAFPQLELVATRSTGFDHIDIGYCGKRGIKVANVPAYGDNTVAEHVFALLLAISHHIVDAVDRTRKGDFSMRGLRGFDLLGKTLGVVGTGNIGRHVIRIARGFAMEVAAFDLRPDEEFAAELGFRYLPLEQLLRQSDILTLHVPATRQTHHMISHEQFAMMKPGTVLINTARGDVVDVRALIQALAEGKIAAAGLDVLPEEPAIREEAELLRSLFTRRHSMEDLLANHVLLRLRNVIITPHSAFNTREAVGRIAQTTRENIEAFAAGASINLVG